MIVVWRVTTRCNLSCAFCAYDSRVPGQRREVGAASVAAFVPVLANYSKQTGDPVLVSWIGGEPMLWQPVFDMSQLMAGHAGIRVSATTNGSTLHLQKVRRRIIDHFAELTVSIDGFAEFHNQVRGWRGGWQRLKAAVMALAAECGTRLVLRANVVVMHDNADDFALLCGELADWGFDEITFNQLGGRDRPEFFPDHRLRPDGARRFAAQVPVLQRQLAERGVRLCANSQYLERIEASANGRALPIPDCAPGQRFLFIDEENRVSPCHFTGDVLGVPLAELASADDLLRLHPRFAAGRERTEPAVCRDCPSTQVFSKFAIRP